MTSEGFRRLQVKHDSGARFTISVRDHEVIVDQPIAAGGADAGPTPTEMFVGSLAACAAFYGRTYLARRGLPDSVDVDALWHVGKRPDRVAAVELLVHAPGVPEDKAAAFHRVLDSCLVHNSIRQGCEITIRTDGTFSASQAG
jgi:putative redox protein